MSRNLDSTMASHLGDGVIQPVVLAQLTLRSGVVYVWSGVGDLVFNGHTYTGVGDLGRVGTISEASDVRADGTTVTLSGIGLSLFDIPPLGVTPPSPPFAPPVGQSMAWALANTHSPDVTFSNGPDVFNAFLGCNGSTSVSLTAGSLGITNGDSLGTNSVLAAWSKFQFPPEIPPGATITGVYPVIVVSVSTGLGFKGASCTGVTGGVTLVTTAGTNTGTNISTLAEATIQANLENSLPGAYSNDLSLSFVGMAVYYEGLPLTKTQLIYEALNDVRIGGLARIWYGLWGNGAFIGTPYLAFSGTVDKPTVKVSSTTTSITLALENRLVNLQRANQRRYTAADQHLAFPDDIAFNWVELLNDMSLKEGTS